MEIRSQSVNCYHDSHAYHYCDVIMSAMVSQITGISTVCSTVCSGADQRKYQSPASLAFARGICNVENVSIWWRHQRDETFSCHITTLYDNVVVSYLTSWCILWRHEKLLRQLVSYSNRIIYDIVRYDYQIILGFSLHTGGKIYRLILAER